MTAPLPYGPAFWGVGLMTAFAHGFATVRARRSEKALAQDLEPRAFAAFQNAYLLVYLLAVGADWLQGPYVYALYTHYGYEKGDVGQLYIAGFASSAVFGTFVAALADKYGRRNGALLYCVTYILSCATKHSGNFYALLLGRLLGGVAYSILFAAFESWMVYEHSARRFAPALLAGTFAKAQLGNGVVAIASAKVSGWFATRYGKVMPFDISIAVLAVLAAIISTTWPENYGDKARPVRSGFADAARSLVRDPKILLIGLIQASFEGAMYTFTFIWTPALQGPHEAAVAAAAAAAANGADLFAKIASEVVQGTQTDGITEAVGRIAAEAELPHGEIFATFMAATMIGSSIFSILSRDVSAERILRVVFVFGVAVFWALVSSQRVEVVYVAFVLFEILCGVYFPAMGTMRTPYLPESNRSALLTFFRVPLNVIVVVILYEDMALEKVFKLCAALLVVAAVCQHILITMFGKSDIPPQTNTIPMKLGSDTLSREVTPER